MVSLFKPFSTRPEVKTLAQAKPIKLVWQVNSCDEVRKGKKIRRSKK
jgi:hypothetical protein